MKLKELRPFLRVSVVCCGLLGVAVASSPASGTAAVPAPLWKVEQLAVPTKLQSGTQAFNPGVTSDASPKLHLTVTNVGGASFENAVVTDTLPIGLAVAPGIEPAWEVPNPKSAASIRENQENGVLQGTCTVVAQTVTCEIPHAVLPAGSIQVYIALEVDAGSAATLSNEVTVESVGAPTFGRRIATEVSSAEPTFEFPSPESEGVTGGAYDSAGMSPQAGEHPFIVELSSKVGTKGAGIFESSHYFAVLPTEALRSIGLSLPSGLVVNPTATPYRCTKSDFEIGEGTCPPETQIGRVTFNVLGAIEGSEGPVYNLVPEPGVPAELGFSIAGASVTIRGGLAGNFQLTAESTELLSRFATDGVRVQLWGIPSDSRHDRARTSTLEGGRCSLGCEVRPSPRPFLTMPSACATSLMFSARATSWLGPTIERNEEFKTAGREPERVEGCQNLQFSPRVTVSQTSSAADSPTGLDFNLKVPQNESLNGLAAATIKKVAVRLPNGMAVNPPAANGLGACSPAQIGLGNTAPAGCPNASKVGTAEIVTPLLDSPLKGAIYLAEQKNNPFGTLLGLYLAVEGEGTVIKLPGRVDVDPRTGQVTTTFDDNPQLPFEELKVALNGGPRAALVTPSSCGTYTTSTEITSWASPDPKSLSTPMVIDQGCSTGGFAPRLEAGTGNPVAGAYSPFTLRVTQANGEQNLSRISATLPEGLLAKLSGVPLCPDAQAGAGDCPSASQVGTTVTGVGAGSQPLYLPQAGKAPTAIYLAGAYRGAPYSLVVKVPAQAGPFDLGTIAVRAALDVDPFTTQVTATSDPLPQILEGIPVAYRDVRVEVNRPEFVRNPTSCRPMEIDASLFSIAGASSYPNSRFQIAGCSSLAFKPSLKLSLRGSTKRVGHPGLRAVLTFPKRGSFANIARAQVNLPGSEFLDQGNLNKTCTKPVLLSGACPATTVYGRAKAWTPLLEKPLEGPVYLVGGFGYKLPAMVADLNGQLRVLLAGKVDSGPNKGIRNTFEAVPDAPVSRFVLELKGGKKYSLLENSENLCHKPQHAIARFTGQNGAIYQFKPLIANQCGSKHRPKGKAVSRGKRGHGNS